VPGKFNFGGLDVLPAIENGFGIANINYADIDPDAVGGHTDSSHASLFHAFGRAWRCMFNSSSGGAGASAGKIKQFVIGQLSFVIWRQ
jgi:hypothetical protein